MADPGTATVAILSLLGTSLTALAALANPIITTLSQKGREKDAAQRAFRAQKRERLTPIYRKVLDAGDTAVTVVRQKRFSDGTEPIQERDTGHKQEIAKATEAVQEIMNAIIMESGSSYVVAAINDLWMRLSYFMIDYQGWMDLRQQLQDAANTPLVQSIVPELSRASESLWKTDLPAVIAAHDTLKRCIQDHLFELEQP